MAQAMASRNILRIGFTEVQARYILKIALEIANEEPTSITEEDKDIALSIVSRVGPRVAGLDYGREPSYTKVPEKPSTLELLGGGTMEEMTDEEEDTFFKEEMAKSVIVQAEVDAYRENNKRGLL